MHDGRTTNLDRNTLEKVKQSHDELKNMSKALQEEVQEGVVSKELLNGDANISILDLLPDWIGMLPQNMATAKYYLMDTLKSLAHMGLNS